MVPEFSRHACSQPTPFDSSRPLTSSPWGHLVCVVRGDAKISGTVTFEQASESDPTTISWDITGHDANAQRGMHIHTFGDNTNGCTSAGPHCKSAFDVRAYSSGSLGSPVLRSQTRPLTRSIIVNPHNKTHGAPSDETRHVGDLGNIETDAQGNSKGSVQDKHVKLIGPESVIGVCPIIPCPTSCNQVTS